MICVSIFSQSLSLLKTDFCFQRRSIYNGTNSATVTRFEIYIVHLIGYLWPWRCKKMNSNVSVSEVFYSVK